MKKCFSCSILKSRNDFYKDRSRKDWCSVYCKICTLKKMKIRYPLLNKEKLRKATIKWRREHPEQFKQHIKKYRTKRREKVLEHYGGKCVCCGETEPQFLTIDHINGGGNKDRKHQGSNLYFMVIKNNFPKTFQLLCWNCNCSKGIYGKCPHLAGDTS